MQSEPIYKVENNCNKAMNEITKNKELEEDEFITQAIHHRTIVREKQNKHFLNKNGNEQYTRYEPYVRLHI